MEALYQERGPRTLNNPLLSPKIIMLFKVKQIKFVWPTLVLWTVLPQKLVNKSFETNSKLCSPVI